jgi:hypothetical protein
MFCNHLTTMKNLYQGFLDLIAVIIIGVVVTAMVILGFKQNEMDDDC